jgi:hypothetical protein
MIPAVYLYWIGVTVFGIACLCILLDNSDDPRP